MSAIDASIEKGQLTRLALATAASVAKRNSASATASLRSRAEDASPAAIALDAETEPVPKNILSQATCPSLPAAAA